MENVTILHVLAQTRAPWGAQEGTGMIVKETESLLILTRQTQPSGESPGRMWKPSPKRGLAGPGSLLLLLQGQATPSSVALFFFFLVWQESECLSCLSSGFLLLHFLDCLLMLLKGSSLCEVTTHSCVSILVHSLALASTVLLLWCLLGVCFCAVCPLVMYSASTRWL